MSDIIARKNGFNQEKSVIRARYPALFINAFGKLLDKDEITIAAVQKKFDKLCIAIRDEALMQADQLSSARSKGPRGRRSTADEEMRNTLRQNTYILMRDFDGLKWWPHVEHLVQRASQGKRARSELARKYADLLHYILRDEQAGKTGFLDAAAIGEVANQLAYAHRHEVPFPFLIGFLAQVRFERAAIKERAGEWEDWYPTNRQADKGKKTKAKA